MNHPFISFLEECPTSFHTALWLEKRFSSLGFSPLTTQGNWDLERGKGYFYKKEGTFFAFVLPTQKIEGLRFFGAHTDSPALKLKPNPLREVDNHLFLALQIYGSPIISTWLDRELAIAGRIFTEKGEEKLVHWKEATSIIPSLPPHLLPKEASISPHLENQLLALISIENSAPQEYLHSLAKERILSHDLFLVPSTPPSILLEEKALSAARLDNLASVFALATGFLPSPNKIHFALFWDHEEIGSKSERGADSTLFERFLKALFSSLSIEPKEAFSLQEESQMFSLDNAHARHPLYANQFSDDHSPRLGKGLAIKESASLRYATSAKGLATLLPILQKEGIPHQSYVVRNDLRGGSTLGPYFAAAIGATTVDLGIPQLAMHSAREIISLQDLSFLVSAIKAISLN